MKNSNVEEVKKAVFPLNLQYFAEGEDIGTDGEGGGDAGDPAGADGNENEPKTFDEFLRTGSFQAEFDRRLQQEIQTALTKQKEKYEVLMDDKLSEAEKLSKMTKEEKEQYLQQKREKDLTDREAAITRRELMAEAKNTLLEKKLPAGLAEILDYKDADTCKASLEAVEKVFHEALEEAVNERLKGGRPPKRADGSSVSYTKEQVSAMSPEEINKNWAAIEESMKSW